MAGVPRIDVGALVDPRSSPDERRPVADAIDAACAEHGFFTVIGHGIEATHLATLDGETFPDVLPVLRPGPAGGARP